MPKMKTHRGAAKRFKKTSSGKYRRNKANRRHILTKKSTKRKRHLRNEVGAFVDSGDAKLLKALLPYG